MKDEIFGGGDYPKDKPKRFEIRREWIDEKTGVISGPVDEWGSLLLGIGDIRSHFGRETVKYRFCFVADVGDSLSLSEGPSYARIRVTIKRVQ